LPSKIIAVIDVEKNFIMIIPKSIKQLTQLIPQRSPPKAAQLRMKPMTGGET
jgi:hypothetical protein